MSMFCCLQYGSNYKALLVLLQITDDRWKSMKRVIGSVLQPAVVWLPTKWLWGFRCINPLVIQSKPCGLKPEVTNCLKMQNRLVICSLVGTQDRVSVDACLKTNWESITAFSGNDVFTNFISEHISLVFVVSG